MIEVVETPPEPEPEEAPKVHAGPLSLAAWSHGFRAPIEWWEAVLAEYEDLVRRGGWR